jgi:hypothetical protein
MQTKELNPFETSSNTLTVFMPSGFTVEIREQNGEDDDILSKYGDAIDGSALHNFLAGIIVNNSLQPGTPTQASDVLQWKVKDKYYLLLKSRMFSLGKDYYFKHTFQDGNTVEFEEDLSMYDWDLSNPKNPLPKEGDKNYFKYRITPYINGLEKHRIITLSSNKKVRYEYLTGIGEKIMLGINETDLSKNDELRIRNLSLEVNGSFQIIQQFKAFSTRDMAEIRRDMELNDTEFKLQVELKNPKNGVLEIQSLASLGSFFFPTIRKID